MSYCTIFIAVSCQKNEFDNQNIKNDKLSPGDYIGLNSTSNSVLTSESLSSINAKLASEGTNFRVAKAELITAWIR